jgi:hypothetical protein
MRTQSLLPWRRSIVVLMLSAGIGATPSLALATDSGVSATPTVVTIPLATAQGFATTSGSNAACPAGGGTPTTGPSVTPTVLGVTFDNPPPTTPTGSNPGGRLPFTGLPLVQSLLVGSALIASGSALVYSRRRHRSGYLTGDSHPRG